MKYYKYPDEYSGIPNAETCIETNDDGCHFRQLTSNSHQYCASNVAIPGFGLALGEGCIDYEEYVESGEVEVITRQEFAEVWQKHLAFWQAEWEADKLVYAVGKIVHGFIQIFYPQGVIVNLGNSVLGVADYEACKASTRPELMYSKQKITAVVSGYDEENQWIVLDSPQVHEERVE